MSKTIVYQVLPRLWGKGKFSSFDAPTFAHLRSLGVTHVWYTGVVRHASGKPFVKGDPGCPYSISDYWDVNPYLADNEDSRIDEFKNLVKSTHEAGLKVLIDFIPNHVSPDYGDAHGGIPHLDIYDGDWTDTRKIDYSHPDTWGRMREIILYWLGMGVDGFRCDMVELVPKDFMRWIIAQARENFPQAFFVAEVYDKGNYRSYIREVGFDLLYDKSGMYDTLMAIQRHGQSAEALTWNWQMLGDLEGNMLNFLENHDEVRSASHEFAGSAERSFAPLAVSALFGHAAFMLYFGEEVGEDAADTPNCRTSIFNWQHAKAVDRLYASLHGGDPLPSREQAILQRHRLVLQLAVGRCLVLQLAVGHSELTSPAGTPCATERTSCLETALGTTERTSCIEAALGTTDSASCHEPALGTTERTSCHETALGTTACASCLEVALGTTDSASCIEAALGTTDCASCHETALGTTDRTSCLDAALGTTDRTSCLEAISCTTDCASCLETALGTTESASCLEAALGTTACGSRDTFGGGEIHDLGYCSDFDRRRFFVWARYDADAMYVLAANFSNDDALVTAHVPMTGETVTIPAPAHDFGIIRLR